MLKQKKSKFVFFFPNSFSFVDLKLIFLLFKSKTQDVTETITKFQDEQKEIVHEQEIRRTNLLELKKQIQGEQAEFTKAVNEAREIEKNIRSIKVQIRSLDSQLLEENKRIAGNTV